MVKEILRWRTVAPLGLPHRCTEDNWYEGMFIPKGTICIANIWHMNHDPNVYGENAADFDPARHLDSNEDIAHGAPNRANTKEEGHVSYGFGRRQCPGLHVADNSLFINIAVMLWATKIERKKVASGQPLPLDVDGFVDYGIVMLAVLQYMLQSMLTWTLLQTSGPLRVRHHSALPRCSYPACTGTRTA
jgi:cytochrome P450